MNKTITILKHEFIFTIRRKFFIASTLSLPLLALLGMFIYQIVQNIDRGSNEFVEHKIGYVDNTGIFTGFTERSNELMFIQYQKEDTVRKDLITEQIDEYFIIPSDYLASGQVFRYISRNELEPPVHITWNIRDFLISNLLAEEVPTDVVNRVRAPMNLTSLELDEKGQVSETRNPIIIIMVPYIFGFLFIMSIFFTSGYLLQSVSEEKENRMIEILLSSVSARQLLLGKILGLGLAGLIQIVVWLITMRLFTSIASVNIPALGDLNIPTSLFVFGFIYFILGYLMFAVLYAGVGSIATTARESQQLSGMFVMPAMLPLILLQVIGEHPDGVVARVLTFIPFTAPVTIMMRLPNTAIPAWELALSLAILVGVIVSGIWFVAKIFRVYLLMYGKRPSLRDIIKYARAA